MHGVVALGRQHLLAEEGDRLQAVAVVLAERGTDGESRGIRRDHVRLRLVGQDEDQSRGHASFERLERLLLRGIPVKQRVLLLQGSEWRGLTAEALDELAVVSGESEERAN